MFALPAANQVEDNQGYPCGTEGSVKWRGVDYHVKDPRRTVTQLFQEFQSMDM